MTGLLKGIKVLELGAYVAAPSATSILADWGASVIKVEPVTGDPMRGERIMWGISRLLQYPGGEVNYIHEMYNRNKRSLALDFKKPRGKEIVLKLVKETDILVTNYVTRSLKEQKLDYPSLKEINPKLIYVLITGYGSSGPDRDEKGYDQTAAWGRSGITDRLGPPGTPPSVGRSGVFDRVTASHAAMGAMAALFSRERTGFGQSIEVSLYQSAVWANSYDVQTALEGIEMPRHDRADSSPLANLYQSKDGRWFVLVIRDSEPNWFSFCQVVDKLELVNDPRFISRDLREKNRTELTKILEKVFASLNIDEWESRFRKHQVIYGKIFTLPEVANDPQAVANGFYQDLEHPIAGKMKLVASPVKFSRNSTALESAGPEIGQHSSEVLSELGYSKEEIKSLRLEKVVA